MRVDLNMDEFIRDTLRSNERIRDKNFSSPTQSLSSKQTFSKEYGSKPPVEELKSHTSLNGGGGGNSCQNLKLYVKGNPAELFVGVGQIGDVLINETSLGSLDSNKGKLVYAKVTLNGQDGTYTAQVVTLANNPNYTATVRYFLLGSVSEAGALSQASCGPVNFSVCRNWYAGEPPYYGISL